MKIFSLLIPFYNTFYHLFLLRLCHHYERLFTNDVYQKYFFVLHPSKKGTPACQKSSFLIFLYGVLHREKGLQKCLTSLANDPTKDEEWKLILHSNRIPFNSTIFYLRAVFAFITLFLWLSRYSMEFSFSFCCSSP